MTTTEDLSLIINNNGSPLTGHPDAEHRIHSRPDEIGTASPASFRSGHHFPQNTPDIDLFDLLHSLCQAWRLLAAYVAIFVLAAVAASGLLPHKWTSTAIITQADPHQWTRLQQSLIAAQTLGVSYPLDRSAAFDLFIRKFQSQQLTEEYINSTPALIQKYSRTAEPERKLRQAVSTVFTGTKALPVTSGRNEPGPLYRSWKLSFTGPDAQSAQNTLRGYINFVADKTIAQIQQEFHDAQLLKIDTEKNGLALALSELQNTRLARIQRLSYALQIAGAAGITAPVYTRGQSLNDDPDFSVALGAKGLAKKLDIEKSVTDLTELNPELRNRKYRLGELEKLSIRSPDFPVFNYQVPPSYPEKREGPEIILVVLLGALMGGLTGGAYVLLRNAAAARRLPS
ncbi:LPS O-antigen length regulator Wzz(fepE) [Enterobacter bugandensis]